jgi:hypothetical protein
MKSGRFGGSSGKHCTLRALKSARKRMALQGDEQAGGVSGCGGSISTGRSEGAGIAAPFLQAP